MNPEVLSFDCRKNSMSCQEKAVVSGDRMLVSVPPHPLIKHWISVLGNEQTPYPVLKHAMAEFGRLLLYEASRNWQFMGYRCRHANTMSCQAAKEKAILSGDRSWVFVPPHHPFIKRWVSMLRNEQTPCPVFKNAMAELGRLLIYEASRDCKPPMSGEIESPMGVASVEFIDPKEPIVMVPILRSGLALAEHAESVLPATKTYHIGISRNEETLQPTVYLNKLPEKFPEGSRVCCRSHACNRWYIGCSS